MSTKSITSLGVAVLLGTAALATGLPAAAEPELSWGGRFHMDGAFYDEDDVPLDDGFLTRRTRVDLGIKLDDTWSGQIQYDFAENNTSAKDIGITRKLAGGKLKIGQFKVPMGLSELSSSNTMPLIEHPSDNNLVADSRRLGIGYDYFSGPLGLQAMAYGRSIGARQEGDMPLGIGGRLVYAPAISDATQLHFGLSAAFEDRRDYDTLRFRDRPEARPDGNRLIDTGTVSDVEDTMKYGLEFGYRTGPLMIEAEYLGVEVNRTIGNEPSFHGYHVQGSYMLTGEQRGYRGGVFRGITPGDPARGAWELTARYSVADLNDAGFQGGEQEIFTVGVNYYARANLRFMVNYIMVDISDSGATVNGVVVGDDKPNVLLARAMFSF